MLTLSYGVGNAEFKKKFPGVIPPDPHFRGEVGEAKLHLLVGPSSIALPRGPHQPKSGPAGICIRHYQDSNSQPVYLFHTKCGLRTDSLDQDKLHGPLYKYTIPDFKLQAK